MRKISAIVPCLAFIALALASCDPVSSLDFKLYNKTSDTVTVDMYEEIYLSSFGGYDVVENDSVTTHYSEADSIYVARLAPDQILWVHDEWSGLYREDWIVPYWEYVRSIMVGDEELPTSSWKNESAWHLRVEGGKRFQGESRYYILTLR